LVVEAENRQSVEFKARQWSIQSGLILYYYIHLFYVGQRRFF